MIGIIDYNMGNLRNVVNAFEKIGEDVRLIKNPDQMNELDKLVLPGVGAFGSLMQFLDENNMRDKIIETIQSNIPFLGICLGYQALFEKSEESPGVRGLGLLEGKVVRFSSGKIPQIGWNMVNSIKIDLIKSDYYYFVNSYIPKIADNSYIAATTDYYGSFVSAIQIKNIFATQFHPERSGRVGLDLLRRWVNC